MLRYLGIDAGFAAPGFAVVDTALPDLGTIIHGECLETKAYDGISGKKKRAKLERYKSEDDALRVICTSDKIAELVLRFKPDVAVIELPSGSGRGSSAVKGMAFAAATAVATCRRLDVPMIYVTPRENKLGSTGNPNAEKTEVLAAIRAFYPQYDGWPRMKLKSRNTELDREQCWAIADAASTVVTLARTPRA